MKKGNGAARGPPPLGGEAVYNIGAIVTVKATGEAGVVKSRTSRTTLGDSRWLYYVSVGGRCGVWLREDELEPR